MHGITFNCSHAELEKNWNHHQDYELIPTVGNCGMCFSKPVTVLTQIGAERFGMHAGYCLRCIKVCIPIMDLEYPVGFKDSEDEHIIRVDSEKLEHFLQSPQTKETFSESEIAELTEAVEKNKSNPDLAQTREFRKKPHQCKNCFGYILKNVRVEDLKGYDPFAEFCGIRSKDNYLVSCLGCSALISRMSGCSILTCPDTLCKVQICAYCLNGASESREIEHGAGCSEKIRNKEEPPVPRHCNCPHEEELNGEKEKRND
jgi:hypothetical protein